MSVDVDAQVNAILEGFSGKNRVAYDEDSREFIVVKRGWFYGWRNLSDQHTFARTAIFGKVNDFFQTHKDAITAEQRRLFKLTIDQKKKRLENRYWACFTQARRTALDNAIEKVQELRLQILPSKAPPEAMRSTPTPETPMSDNKKYPRRLHITGTTSRFGQLVHTPTVPSTAVKQAITKKKPRAVASSVAPSDDNDRLAGKLDFTVDNDSSTNTLSTTTNDGNEDKDAAPIVASSSAPPPPMPGTNKATTISPPLAAKAEEKKETILTGEKIPSEACLNYKGKEIKKLEEDEINKQIKELDSCIQTLEGILTQGKFKEHIEEINKINGKIHGENDPEMTDSLARLRLEKKSLSQNLLTLSNQDTTQRLTKQQKKQQNVEGLFLPKELIDEGLADPNLSDSDKKLLGSIYIGNINEGTQEKLKDVEKKLKTAEERVYKLKTDLQTKSNTSILGVQGDDIEKVYKKKMDCIRTWTTRKKQREQILQSLANSSDSSTVVSNQSEASNSNSSSLNPIIADALQLAKQQAIQLAIRQGSKAVAALFI